MASIWEKMLLEETKQKAVTAGLSLADYEDHERLRDALEQSKDTNAIDSIIEDLRVAKKDTDVETTMKSASAAEELADDEDCFTYFGGMGSFSVPPPVSHTSSTNESSDSHMKSNNLSYDGGPWIHLPTYVAQRIVMFIGDVDMCGYLQIVAKTNPFAASEVVYKHLCSIIYPAQTRKKQLIVENWRTWRNMLIYRPR